MSASRPSLWQSLITPLTGRFRPAPTDYDDWPELKAKLDAAMSDHEKTGKDWLRVEIAATPMIRISTTRIEICCWVRHQRSVRVL